MEYSVTINKKFRYVKVYRIIKKTKGEPNFISKKMQSLVDKLVKEGERERSTQGRTK